MSKSLTAYFDGASKGNPGPSGIGGVIIDHEQVVSEIKKYIGTATNNQAEYTALIEVLRRAKELGAEVLSVYSDSELVVRQLNGEYQIKDPKLRLLFDEVLHLRRQFQKVTFTHVLRAKNKLADALANQGVAEGRPDRTESEWVEFTLDAHPLKNAVDGLLTEMRDACQADAEPTLANFEAELTEHAKKIKIRLKRNGKALQMEL